MRKLRVVKQSDRKEIIEREEATILLYGGGGKIRRVKSQIGSNQGRIFTRVKSYGEKRSKYLKVSR